MAIGTLDGKIEARITVTSGKSLDFNTVSDPLDLTATLALALGDGANQANEVFRDRRPLAASGTESLDLAGVLTNAFGETITFARVRVLYVKNNDTVTLLQVGGAASSQWFTWLGTATDLVVLRPGGFLLLVSPGATSYTVTAGTADKLGITRGAGTVTDNTYDIVLIGSTA